jgi:CheY-like chemotaxis protein
VSHELRTPLTSIRGSLGLVLGVRAHELSEKVKSLIEIAYNNCERLVLLINDILDIDKIASGHMRFDFRSESLAAVTQQAVQANEAYARKFDVRIDLQPIDERIQVKVDAARYIQVLSNLLSNAAKFSSTGGSIQVKAEANGEHVRVSVEDHGSGIPEEFQSRIFGKFSQADASASRQKGGTGLGLHITKQLVERMNGRVGFTTEVGKGTTFWVEFPIVALSVATTRESEDPVLYFKELESHRSLVLHIEDDADLSKMLAEALADEVEVITATTLRQAEELLRRRSFAIIILDVGMPDGSGLDLLRRLNTLTEVAPPVVILSVDLPPVEVRDQVAAVMVKTRTPEEKIVQTVLSLLRQSSAAASTPQARA